MKRNKNKSLSNDSGRYREHVVVKKTKKLKKDKMFNKFHDMVKPGGVDQSMHLLDKP